MRIEERPPTGRAEDAAASTLEPEAAPASDALAHLAEKRRQERRLRPPPLPSRRPPALPPLSGGAPPEVATHAAPPRRGEPTPPPIVGLPAEPPSAWERYNPQTLRRQWWWERWRETPCWLTSMVLHLAVVLAIGSIAVPPSRVTGFNSWVLAFADEHDPLAEADLVIFQTDERQEDGGERGVQLERPQAAEEPPAAPEPLEIRVPEPLTLGGLGGELAEHLPSEPTEETRPAEEPPPELLSTAASLPPAMASADVPPSGGEPPGTLDVSPIYDYMVDQFILYDIGQLKGVAGERARREFESLGPYAIPALVRGLNRSASIQASCPVVVIASKLEQSLAQSNDYQIIRYAVDNIGRDVPRNAPHLARLETLRNALRRQHLDRAELVRQEFAEQGVPVTDHLVQTVLHYSDAAPDVLTEGIHAADSETRLAAISATSRLGRPLTPGQRSHLAGQLLMHLDDETSAVRDQVEAGLGALLATPSPAATSDDSREERAAFWRQQRETFDETHRLERTARGLLSLGTAHERRGRRGAAVEKFRQVLAEFPGTRAAQEAAVKLGAAPPAMGNR